MKGYTRLYRYRTYNISPMHTEQILLEKSMITVLYVENLERRRHPHPSTIVQIHLCIMWL